MHSDTEEARGGTNCVKLWKIAIEAESGGRCYLSRHWQFRQWLIAYKKWLGFDDSLQADVFYRQVGVGKNKWTDAKCKVVQTVTYASDELAAKTDLAEWELSSTVGDCARADMVIAHSKLQRNALVSIGVEQNKIKVVRPAPMASALSKELTRNKLCGAWQAVPVVAGVAGQPIPRKRIEFAVEAAKIVGLELRHATKIEPTDMSQWYQGVDLFLFPTAGDSWGIVVSEAIAAGIPVVVSPLAGAAEEVKETGAGVVAADGTKAAFIEATMEAVRRYPMIRQSALDAPLLTVHDWVEDLIRVSEGGA